MFVFIFTKYISTWKMVLFWSKDIIHIKTLEKDSDKTRQNKQQV